MKDGNKIDDEQAAELRHLANSALMQGVENETQRKLASEVLSLTRSDLLSEDLSDFARFLGEGTTLGKTAQRFADRVAELEKSSTTELPVLSKDEMYALTVGSIILDPDNDPWTLSDQKIEGVDSYGWMCPFVSGGKSTVALLNMYGARYRLLFRR